MGIGWSLHNRDGTQILHGSGAIHPTQSPTEAEAEALRLAVLDLRRLGYSHVTFCGDLKLIYDTLQRCALRGNNASWKYLHIATYLADVLKISKLCSFNFIHISRDANDIADRETPIKFRIEGTTPSFSGSVFALLHDSGTQLCLGQLPSYVSLPSLKSLFIDTIVFYDIEDLCCVLLAGCPVLEELSVHHHDFIATPHTISSPTLKRLSVDYHCPDDVDSASHMSFDLPKLVYLEYSHCALGEYWQINLESLVEAKLDLGLERKVLRMDVTDLIIGIRNVQSLHLSPDSVHDLNGYTGDVSMPLNKVTSLHILGYRGTADEVKQLKSFIGEFECLELVQVDVAEAAEDNGKILQSKRDLMMLLGVSLPSKCQFKSVLDELNVRVSGILVIGVLDGTQLLLIILLHILGKGNKPLAALTTLNHMKEVGIDPSVLHYTTLIDGYVVSGELDKAKEMFREMTVKGQLPNVFTYNSMIRGLCMAGEFREACWLLKEMESRGCNPNFVVYSTLVGYLRKAGKLSEARKVIKEMVKKGHYVHLVSKMMKYRR
ncbi:unnamed protein product [Arabidopsis thaliana]|uniref:(thale cress) hypothetical protein n=1 Tax=Arabidopsis thaliana TaxID=3702 RepID=A0A7G2EVA0_ARATH|nr:unnamed protein product [Arabidopsis thaliana]